MQSFRLRERRSVTFRVADPFVGDCAAAGSRDLDTFVLAATDVIEAVVPRKTVLPAARWADLRGEK